MNCLKLYLEKQKAMLSYELPPALAAGIKTIPIISANFII